MKKYIVLILLLLGVIAFVWYNRKKAEPIQEPTETPLEDIVIKRTTDDYYSPNSHPMSLQILTHQQGTGDRVVEEGDTVSVRYIGNLLDGTRFDASEDHGDEPFSFKVGEGKVIEGWEKGVLGAKVGEKRTLTIPPSLGYGEQGVPDVIPPNATLLFDIEVISIE